MICPECRGRGKIDLLTSSVPCGKCGGTGNVGEPPALESMSIPASGEVVVLNYDQPLQTGPLADYAGFQKMMLEVLKNMDVEPWRLCGDPRCPICCPK